MALGLIGTKRGMSRLFTADGRSVPVTLVEITPHRVVALKTAERDGYRACQVTWGQKRASRLNRSEAGLFAKVHVEPGEGLYEFRLNEGESEELQVGAEFDEDMFADIDRVDVRGLTIGKGFAGVVKRHNFHMQDASHGNSLSHRAPGSIGQNQTPGRVFKGKKMAGHMGDVYRTTQNLKLVREQSMPGYLLIKGAVPGARGSRVRILPSIKSRPDKQSGGN